MILILIAIRDQISTSTCKNNSRSNSNLTSNTNLVSNNININSLRNKFKTSC